MMTNPNILRRVYDLAALLALLNMIALAGLGAFLLGTGAVDLEKLRQMVMVLRGEGPSATDQSDVALAETDHSRNGEVAQGNGVDSQEQLEILRLEAARIRAELDQRLALNNSIMLRVTTQKDAFQQERQDAERRERASQARRQEEGFKKQIAIYEGLAPKFAIQHLLALDDPDEAARILLEMETRKAKKIVEAAKRDDQMRKMQKIVERIRAVAPDRSEEMSEEN